MSAALVAAVLRLACFVGPACADDAFMPDLPVVEAAGERADVASSLPCRSLVGIASLLVLSAFGSPVPEDIVVPAAGALARAGIVDPLAAFATCYLCILLTDTLVFFAGRLGKGVLRRRWFRRLAHPRRLAWAQRQVLHHGTWGIVMSRFVPGARGPTLLVAGAMQLPLARFACAELPALIGSVSLEFALGWIWMQGASAAAGSLERRIALGLAIVAGALLGSWLLLRATQWVRRAMRGELKVSEG